MFQRKPARFILARPCMAPGSFGRMIFKSLWRHPRTPQSLMIGSGTFGARILEITRSQLIRKMCATEIQRFALPTHRKGLLLPDRGCGGARTFETLTSIVVTRCE